MEKKLFLLGLLRAQDMHGYQLNEFIEGALAMCVSLKRPTAYYTLNKLHEEGLVAYTEEQEGNRPPRRVYGITPAGEAAFQTLLREELGNYRPTELEGDISMAYLDVLAPAEALTLLAQRRAGLVAQHTAITAVPSHPGSLQLMIDHQRHHLTAELAWLDELIGRLETISNE